MLDQINLFLWQMHIETIFRVNSQKCLEYMHKMDPEIVLVSERKWELNMAQASS